MSDSSRKNHNHLLAEALEKARAAAKNNVIRSSELDRSVREQLVRASFLTEVMRGWYLLTNPAGAGTTTLWYSNYWEFIKQYLADRFGSDGYCLNAESSLNVYAAQNVISQQLVIITKKPTNQTVDLPHGTSLLLYGDEKNFPATAITKDDITILPVSEALCRASPAYFHEHSLNAQICLKLVAPAEISRSLLSMRSTTVASRIAGAYRALGEDARAEQLEKDFAAAGLSLSATDPFHITDLLLRGIDKISSPYSGRIQAMWKAMRGVVIENFPVVPTTPDTKESLKIIEKLYQQDAYHSLSIEGYQVTEELIRKIKEGAWSPDTDRSDNDQRNAMAAKGYLEAFRIVTGSVKDALRGSVSPSQIFSRDLQTWYRALFAPSVQSGIVKASDLAGYRNSQVYISTSRHVPPPHGAVLDSMETLEKLLQEEDSAAVRAVLGHFVFGFIHPYMDGNGRIARFLMNLMLVSGGYNWTVIRMSERMRYLSGLESASTEGKIIEFTKLVAAEMEYWKRTVSKMSIERNP